MKATQALHEMGQSLWLDDMQAADLLRPTHDGTRGSKAREAAG